MIIIVVALVVFSVLALSYKALTQTRLAERFKDNRSVQAYLNVLAWAGRLLPPLLLLPLFVMPFDVMTAMVWFIGGIAALYSIAGLLKKQERRNKIRPGLTLIIFSTGFVYMLNHTAAVRDEIDAMARQSAQAAQAGCNDAGTCPDLPPGWQDTCRAIEAMRACYRLSDDNKLFSISIRYHIDSYRVIEGGVDTPLREEVFFD